MFFSISQITLVYYGKLLKEKGQDAVAHKIEPLNKEMLFFRSLQTIHQF